MSQTGNKRTSRFARSTMDREQGGFAGNVKEQISVAVLPTESATSSRNSRDEIGDLRQCGVVGKESGLIAAA
jgi:hypothetical protein